MCIRDRYDLTKHPLYRYTADYDKKYAFDIERFLSHRLKLKPDDAVEAVSYTHLDVYKRQRLRLFLSDVGYAKAQASEKRGEIKIRKHAAVIEGHIPVSYTHLHLLTGFIGTPFACLTLSENGRHDLAGRLLLQEDDPSWLYSVSYTHLDVYKRQKFYSLVLSCTARAAPQPHRRAK